MKKINLVMLGMVFGTLGQVFAYTEHWAGPADFFPPNLYCYYAAGDSGSWDTLNFLSDSAQPGSYFEDISNGSGQDLFNGNNFSGWGRWGKLVTRGAYRNWTEILHINFVSCNGSKPTTQQGQPNGSGSWTGNCLDSLIDPNGNNSFLRSSFDCGGSWYGTFNYNNNPPSATGTAQVTWPSDTLLSNSSSWSMSRNYYRP